MWGITPWWFESTSAHLRKAQPSWAFLVVGGAAEPTELTAGGGRSMRDGERSDHDAAGPADEAPVLGPHAHPSAGGRYSHVVGGRRVHVDAAHVGDLFASGLRTWDDPLVAGALAPARGNADLAEDELALLPWAMTTTSAQTPDSLGVVGRASYSGPGATALVGNMAHSRRAYAFAAELVTAACLVYRGWASTDGTAVLGDARERDARLDFGVKLLGAGTARRTAEADVLLSSPDGRRAAVDVKATRAGAFRTPPSRAMLEIVQQALDRHEITSFHFVTRGRFRPAFRAAVAGMPRVHVHEGVWPGARDRESIRRQEAQAIDFGKAVRAAQRDGVVDFDALVELLADEAAAAYRRATDGSRSLVRVPRRFTSLLDRTPAASDADAGERVVAAWGRTSGDGTVGLDLIRHDRGRGADARRRRTLERLVAGRPGTGVFVRALYDDASDRPVRLDHLVVTTDGVVELQRLRARPCAP